MSDIHTLSAIVSTMDTENSSQASVTRTRAQLLTVKKLCDTLRKELLLQGKMLKETNKAKKVGFLSIESAPSSPMSLSADDELTTLNDLVIREPDLLSEPLDLDEPPAPPVLKRERTTRPRKTKVAPAL
jgi:hypothetical protein